MDFQETSLKPWLRRPVLMCGRRAGQEQEWADPSGPGSADPHRAKDEGAGITSASQHQEDDSVQTRFRV